jgi:hypothetical protein
MDHLTSLKDANNNPYPNPVKYIELWNEANTFNATQISGFWGPAADPDYGLPTLAAMAAKAYPIIHNYFRCTPNCPLVLSPSAVGAASGPVPASGNIDPIVPDWISKYLNTGTGAGKGKNNLDGIAFHGYLRTAAGQHAWPEFFWKLDFGNCPVGTICNSGTTFRTCPNDGSSICYGPLDTLITSIRSKATTAGVSTSVPLIDTEGGWGTGDLDSASGLNPALPLDTAYVARWYLLQAGLAATSNLRAASWYFWDPSCSSNCLQGDWGTLGYLSGSTLTPYGTAGKTLAPGSGLAVGWLAKWLTGSTITTPCGPAPVNADIWLCNLTLSDGDGARIVWYTLAGTATYTTSAYSKYQDLTGCLTSFSGAVTLAQQPVILLTKDETTLVNEGWGKATCQ